jgi:hypothetical protein
MLRLQSLFLYSFFGPAVQQVYGLAILDSPYQSQLHGEGHPDAIPDSYMVAFKQNYTIAQHWQTIGTDLSNAAGFVHFDAFWGYAATLVSLTSSQPVIMDQAYCRRCLRIPTL